MPQYLSNVKKVMPLSVIRQEDGLKWIAAQHNFKKPRQLALLERVSCQPSAIATRYSAVPDFNADSHDEPNLFGVSEPSISERLDVYQREVTRAIRLLDLGEDEPEHILHVTCTGYVSPSPIQVDLSLNHRNQVKTTNLYHMGCYAALPAVRTAAAISQGENKVKVVHNELCTLHFQSSDKKAEQLVIQSLFADGHCSYLVTNVRPTNRRSFKILAQDEMRVPETLDHMTWKITEKGFCMSLDRKVPEKLGECIEGFLNSLAGRASFDRDQTIFAIHPGGPKIIAGVADSLGLGASQIKHAEKVLFNYGNMSSVTVPFIWHEILEDETVRPGTKVVSLAFGPGLSLFGSVFEVCDET